MSELPEKVDGLPNICGADVLVQNGIRSQDSLASGESNINFEAIKSACAIALHMHQPLIPAGGDDPYTAKIISNLQHMMEHQTVGENHNAPAFHWCYKRMGELIPQLVEEGRAPRVMLDYSGCLLHGLKEMGADDVLARLKDLTCNERYRHCVEWLGTPWSHALAPSTPVQDYRLHVQAWQHHFAAIFGLQALGRVKGFSPAEMAVPNHPDVFFEFVKTLKDQGFTWVLVPEYSIEQADTGKSVDQKYIPHRLIAQNSTGESIDIVAIIKTQSNDPNLVGQMQPYYEAKDLTRIELGGKQVPPLVTQISDGENSGVMMTEFPLKYMEVVREASYSDTPMMNVAEYLERLFAMGITKENMPTAQPIRQHSIWKRFERGAGPEKLTQVIEELKQEDGGFFMESGNWTNNSSWVESNKQLLDPIMQCSARFSEKVLTPGIPSSDPTYRKALFYLLITQTSCYHYWGQELWSDYAQALCHRATDCIESI